MPYQPYQPTWNNTYLPQVQQPQYMPIQPSMTQTFQQPTNGIIKVNGRDSALQYQLPPNSMSPALFDQNGVTFYIVSTDGTGAKTVEAFDYQPHKDEQPIEIDGARFVSRDEFDEFAAKVNAVIGAFDAKSKSVHEPVQPAAPAAAEPVGVLADVPASGAGRHSGRA